MFFFFFFSSRRRHTRCGRDWSSDVCSSISVFKKEGGPIYYINISQDDFKLGGSSFSQIIGKLGNEAPDVKDAGYVKTVFNTIQDLIQKEHIIAGHDVASGGLITTLLEMCFADNNIGAEYDLTSLKEEDSFKILFAENSGIVFQAKDASVAKELEANNITFHEIGKVVENDFVSIINGTDAFTMTVSELRDT